MKSITTLILSIFTAIIFNACTNEKDIQIDNDGIVDGKIALTQEELTSISFDDFSEVPENEVLSMITDFINLKSQNADTRSTATPQFTVKTKSYLKKQSSSESTRSANQASGESIPVYDVIVENDNITSYAVVSADKRAPNVLAFIENFPTDENEIQEGLNNPNTRAMLSLAKGQLIDDIENVEQIKTDLREKTITKICKQLNIPFSEYSFEDVADKLSVNGEIVTRNHIGVQEPLGNLIAEKKPMCKIIWEQKAPYNGECPLNSILIPLGEHSFVVEGRVPAGCVTIACIHAEACVERPSIGGIPMDWSYYKEAKTMDEGVTPALKLERAQKAIRYIYDQLGSSPVGAYYNGTWYVHATGSTQGENYIMKNFKYEKHQKFDPDIVLASLNANKPVYISGEVYGNQAEDENDYGWERHAFVIDGYMIRTKLPVMSPSSNAQTRSDIVQYYDMYWHINLGWGDNSNAYFRLDSDATCTPQFIDKYGRYNLVPTKDMMIISHLSIK